MMCDLVDLYLSDLRYGRELLLRADTKQRRILARSAIVTARHWIIEHGAEFVLTA